MAIGEIGELGGISLNLQVLDGNTVPSADISGTKVYLDIGSGTILRLIWRYNPVYIEDSIDSYTVTIRFKASIDVTASNLLYTQNMGKINEFFITSEILSKISLSDYYLDIGISSKKHGESAVYETAVVENIHIRKASGMYVEVSEGYAQPIMKRAVAFARIPDQEDIITKELLLDENGEVLTDEDGTYLVTESGNQEPINTAWKLMEDFYIKDSEGNWQKSDIRYEVLTDSNGEIVTDGYGDPIYVL